MTNNLTNDMTRLCGEIAALRDSRAELMSNLAQSGAEMRAAIGLMLGDFGVARSAMAKQTKADLGGFVVRVKDAVTALRQEVAQWHDEFRHDLAGAHRAWHGAGPARRPEPTIASSSFRAEEPSGEFTPKVKKKKR